MQSLPRKRTQERPGAVIPFAGEDMTLAERPFDEDAAAWLEVSRLGRMSQYSICGGEFLIGRASHCHLVLESDRRFVSREHASITASDGCYCISDLSINGTWLNGARLTRLRPEPLRSGDAITIEDWELTFRTNSHGDAHPA